MTNLIYKLPNIESPLDAASVSKRLRALEGVESVHVSLKDKEVHIAGPSGLQSDRVDAALREINYAFERVESAPPLLHSQMTRPLHGDHGGADTKSSTRVSYPVGGMTCAACAVSVESMLKAQEGVVDAGVNYANQSAYVEYLPAFIGPEQMRDVVRSIGYDLLIDQGEDHEALEREHEKRLGALRIRVIVSGILSLPVVMIAMFFHHSIPFANIIMMILAAPVLLWAGREFFVSAYKKALHATSNMDTLVALSTGVAFVYSGFATLAPSFFVSRGLEPHVYFEAASVIIFFILLGRYLEEKAKSRTSSAIKNLMGLQPKTMTVLRDGVEVVLPIEQARMDDRIVIKPGERIPVDGAVSDGTSFIDESMITGEPVPVRKQMGDKVFAGTINQKGGLIVTAQKVGRDTMLANIIRLVREAQGSKAPIQKLADRVAAVFVPVVIGISVLSFAAWMAFGPEPTLTRALLSMITVLIIACPCALGLATPTAIMVGVGRGAERGILIKNAESLELAQSISAIVLDKTGTITVGQPEVSDLMWTDGNGDARHEISALYSIESRSEHPIADAVKRRLEEYHPALLPVVEFESRPGRGVRASVDDRRYLIGNDAMMAEQGIGLPPTIRSEAKALEEDAKTVVFFADEKRILAVLAVTDLVREGSADAVRGLKSMGIETHLLTGDNEHSASAVAAKLGIDHYRSGVLPGDKGEYVKKLQQTHGVVAMVGDGINDSHALAQADVSIAMGKGTDIAMDVSAITLMNSDIRHVVDAIRLSRATVRTIRQNLFWAFVYNVIGIPIAAGVLYPVFGFLLNPMIAGMAMAMSSVSVVSNSLRLKTKKI